MENGYQNIYRLPRVAAGITQERASELLGISVKSLSNYETGVTIPGDDVVLRMATVYNAQYLTYQHLSANNELAGRVVPQLEERTIQEAAIRVCNRLRRFVRQGKMDDLMEIAEDGVITEDEKDLFNGIMEDLVGIAQSSLEMDVFCNTGKEEG